MTTTLEIELPDTTTKDEAKLLLALKMYEVGKISLRQVAKMAGFSKRAFLAITIAFSVLAVVSAMLFKRGKWKEKVV